MHKHPQKYQMNALLDTSQVCIRTNNKVMSDFSFIKYAVSTNTECKRELQILRYYKCQHFY
jgi:hypothetical protein